jgi:hypothetical protein
MCLQCIGKILNARQRNVLRVKWNLIGWMYAWKVFFLEAEQLVKIQEQFNKIKWNYIFLIWMGCWIFLTWIECVIRKLPYQLKFMDRRAAERSHIIFFLEKKQLCMSSFINWKPNLITNCRFFNSNFLSNEYLMENAL